MISKNFLQHQTELDRIKSLLDTYLQMECNHLINTRELDPILSLIRTRLENILEDIRAQQI